MTEHIVQVWPWQQAFLSTGLEGEVIDYLFSLAHCGRGAGKTYAGALRMMSYICKYPDAYGMITAPTYDNFVANTFPPIQKAFDILGFREGQDWEYIKNEKHLMFFPTNAHVFVRTTDDASKLAGPDLSFFWMDEARESPREAFAKLVGCLRRDGFPRQGWITSTPAGRTHWFFEFWRPEEYYLENPDLERPQEDSIGTFLDFQGNTSDNPYSRAMGEMLERVYGRNSAMAKQETKGEFVFQEDMVFETWDRNKHMRPLDEWPGKPKLVVAGVDFGFDAPTAFLIGGVDDDKRVYLQDEFYKRKLSNEEIGIAAIDFHRKYNVRFFICDSASPEKIKAINTALINKRIPSSKAVAVSANKKVGSLDDLTSGIGLCYKVMSDTISDGTQALYVNPSLINFRREVENWTREKSKIGYPTKSTEKPRVSPDHLIDSFRYMMNFLARRGYIGQVKPFRVANIPIKIGV